MVYHVRRRDKEITDQKTLRRILKTVQYMTVAMARENSPYLVSLSCGYDEERHCIYFHCADEGKKLDFLKTNNSVWGQALLDYSYEHGECDHQYASVHFSGKVTFVQNLEEKVHAIKCMIKQLDKNPEKLIERLEPGKLEKLKSTMIGRIDVEYMSGKKSEKIKV
ncbi:MAG: pyridoxamine 5'-phosphate oxidase family protein [Candidatus Bathyarchaeia archaeon]